MTLPHHSNEQSCTEARAQLQVAWVEGRIGQIALYQSQKGQTLPDTDTHLAGHLEACASCKKESQALASIEKTISHGCRLLKQATPLPSEDEFAKMLSRVDSHPDTATIKRIRRTLRPILWITLIFFSLLACCVLLAAAYKIFVQ